MKRNNPHLAPSLSTPETFSGAGLGLRRSISTDIKNFSRNEINFLEIAPENWMGLGGLFKQDLNYFKDNFPLICHGLSLSLGGPDPLDKSFIHRLKDFFNQNQILCYSEHLSYCTDGGHLYDLIPMPFTEQAVKHVSSRIIQAQELLQRHIAVENISYYATPKGDMTELEFILAVIEEADCELLLDVNNVYVNSHNHGYQAKEFIDALPKDKIAYIHVAGHLRESEDLIIDTHGDKVIDPVWDLLKYAYQTHGVKATLLERDFNFPAMADLMEELQIIKKLQKIKTLDNHKNESIKSAA